MFRFLDIGKGMEYLSQCGKISFHGDLGLRNYLLTRNPHNFNFSADVDSTAPLQFTLNPFFIAKVGDFGHALPSSTKLTPVKNSSVPWPVAPEAMNPHSNCNNHTQTFKSDVWRFALSIWELFPRCQEPKIDYFDPFPIKCDQTGLYEQLATGLKLDFKIKNTFETSEEMILLIQKCMDFYPEKRPTFGEIVKVLQTFIENEFKRFNSDSVKLATLGDIKEYLKAPQNWGISEQQQFYKFVRSTYKWYSLLETIPSTLTDQSTPASNPDILESFIL